MRLGRYGAGRRPRYNKGNASACSAAWHTALHDCIVRSSVTVPVMQIRIMRMGVFQRRVDVRMGVRFDAVPCGIVGVLVVIVVRVAMIVFERFMLVCVRMALADVQPHADSHQCAGNPERELGRFAQQQQ